MIETYTNKATTWAHKQEDASGNSKVADASGNKMASATATASATNANAKDLSGNIQQLSQDTGNLFYTIFNKSNIILIIWFLAIYFVVYFLLGFFMKSGSESSNFQLRLSNLLDMMFLGIALLLIISYFYSSTEQQKTDWLSQTYKQSVDYINAPTSLLSTGLFILVFYIAVYLFRFPMTPETKPIFVSFIETIAWCLFVIIGFVDFFTYVLGIPIKGMFNGGNWWNLIPDDKKVVDVSGNKATTVDVSTNVVVTNEVFNISNNLYTYDDAQAICKAYGANLATYDQIEEAYNKGGEWCNYGWSDGQMIFFPTQRSTWTELQKNTKHKNDCGRPGVNGGYMANPYLKFGVNCYGTKPKPSDKDLNRMTAKQNQVFPKTDAEKAIDAKVNYWKDNADKLLQINSHNTKKWSQMRGNA
jgi:hypothetical protein